ncbi:hypothetical protein DESC_880008 [Desulfosarcina cetonica]|nr:hypothetical protein DESC_880008 [Desulfosarcina cetonica]
MRSFGAIVSSRPDVHDDFEADEGVRRRCSLPVRAPLAPTGNQLHQVGQDQRQGQAAGGSQVARLPHRPELVLVLPEPFEIVEVTAAVRQKCAQSTPQGRQGVVGQAAEGCHAQVEPRIALILGPLHELDEKKVHYPVGRRGRVMPHQVDGKFRFVGPFPEIGEGHDGVVLGDHGHVEPPQVAFVETAQGKALFPAVFISQPTVRDASERIHARHGLFG